MIGCATFYPSGDTNIHSDVMKTFNLRADQQAGGFSGLIYQGRDESTGALLFVTHTDRGPNDNGKAVFPGSGGKPGPVQIFFDPKFQPSLVFLKLDFVKGELTVSKKIGLRTIDGKAVTGLPNRPEPPSADSTGDEIPTDADLKIIKSNPMGLDLEAIVHAQDGSYWMGDEYRPSLCRFSKEGVLLDRLIPEGAGKVMGREILPAIFKKRTQNRGFEGVARVGNKIYGFLQSPLISKHRTKLVRIVEYDTKADRATGVFLYNLDSEVGDRKLGDVTALPNGKFLVLEQTGEKGARTDKKIYRIDLSQATNLLSRPGLVNEDLEALNETELSVRGVKPGTKGLIFDLAAAGYRFTEKAEGLTFIDNRTLAVVNDNDFGINGEKSTIAILNLTQDLFP